MFRRVLFQVHRWVGVALSLYLVVVTLTGVSLIFRPELQQFTHPRLFAVQDRSAVVDPAAVIASVQRAYPRYRVSGIDAPTTARATWLAYVAADGHFLTVLIDPATAEVRGEMPDQSPVRTLQSLHFDLLAGARGRALNGVGAACLLLMAVSGAIVWWPGATANALAQRLRVDFRGGWRGWSRELHALIGIAACASLLMWALSGLYFAYPAVFRTGVSWITPLGKLQPVQSVAAPGAVPLEWSVLLDAARGEEPDRFVARVVLPANDRGAVEVLFAHATPTPVGDMDLQSVFVDPYTVRVLPAGQLLTRGDRAMNWLSALHVGNFGGTGVRLLWAMVGLMPALLAVTGVAMWWSRRKSA